MIWLICCAAVFLVDIFLFSFNQYAASLAVLIANACLAYVMIPEVSTQVAATPLEVAVYYALVYAGTGIVISCIKWILYIRKTASEIGAIRETFDMAKSILRDDKSANEFQRVATHINDTARNYPGKYSAIYNLLTYDGSQPSFHTIKDHGTLIAYFTPSAKSHVDNITYWVILWPFVIVDTAFRDILINFGKHVATLISNVFGGITRAIIRRAIGNVDPIPAPESTKSVLNETASRG